MKKGASASLGLAGLTRMPAVSRQPCRLLGKGMLCCNVTRPSFWGKLTVSGHPNCPVTSAHCPRPCPALAYSLFATGLAAIRHQTSFLGPPWQHRLDLDLLQQAPNKNKGKIPSPSGIPSPSQLPSSRCPHCRPSPAMNGHFAAVGDGADDANFEHGIQVIDGDKEFTCVAPLPCRCAAFTSPCAARLTQTDPAMMQVPSRRLPRRHPRRRGRLQLPPHLRLRVPVDGQVDAAQPPLWHRVQCHVRVRTTPDD